VSAAAARLCGLLLLALAAATGCAPAPGQAAARAIERLGGKAVFAPPAGDAPAALRRIDLAHTQVSDADLVRLAREWGGAAGPLATVEELDLTHTAVGDEAVAALPEFPALRKLSLTLTRVGDGGLAPLARLDRLAELYLADTPVTDAAVATLEKLPRLRTLVLLRTEVSDAAAARLRRALPDALVQAPARSASGPRRDAAGRRP
jgi:hypothetical protein